jgi:hypothetical protein
MKTKIEISNRKLLVATQVLGKFINESKVAGVPVDVRYWLGRNYEKFQKEVEAFESARKKLVETHGDVIAVRKEKLEEFFTIITVFKDFDVARKDQAKKYWDASKELGVPSEMFAEIEKAYPDLKEKFDEWMKNNPFGNQKEVITAKHLGDFNKDFEELLNIVLEIGITTIALHKVSHLSEDPDFGALLSQATILWEEPRIEPSEG